MEALSKDGRRRIHLTGGGVSHFPEGEELLKQLQHDFPELQYHGWLREAELLNVLKKCRYSTWLDQGEIEPLLGSRTRALFAIWHGLKIFGSPQTELAQFLIEKKAMVPWNENIPISSVFDRLSELDPRHAQDICHQYFNPAVVYAPILRWLDSPLRIKKASTDYPVLENQRLRRQLRGIYASRTWKITNRIHRLLF